MSTHRFARDLPLQGVRVLAVEQYGAGPYGSLYLAQLGAEVIKIEPVETGEVSRATGPYFLGERDSHFFQTFNQNKKSLMLNLKCDQGQAVLHDLVKTADALSNNLRGDQPTKLGLDYARLGKINSALVCAHLSAYGRDNDRAERPGYDYLMQAEAGFMGLTGEPGTPPARFGLSMVDFMTGVVLASGLLAALLGVARGGRGRDVDVSLFDVALHQLSYPATWYLNENHVTERMPRSAHPSATPCQLFRCAGGWLFIAAILSKFWEAMLEITGLEALAEDDRFADVSARRKHQAELTEILDTRLSEKTGAEWMLLFAGKVPAAPVYNLEQALQNPWLANCDALQNLSHPHCEQLRVLANPVRLDGARLEARAAPAVGADSLSLLTEIGYSQARIEELLADGVVGNSSDHSVS